MWHDYTSLYIVQSKRWYDFVCTNINRYVSISGVAIEFLLWSVKVLINDLRDFFSKEDKDLKSMVN